MTPIRRQYLQIKRRYPEAVVLFRLGDFYETFDDDARLVARELDITLTSKPMGKGLRVPLAGIPYHALDSYLARLVNKGYKVAICEQLTSPQESRGLVERDVVRVVTPGTVVEPNLLPSKANNYLAALALGEDQAGISYIDITTSEFATTQLPLDSAPAELARLQPAEVLLSSEVEVPAWVPGNVSRVEPTWFEVEPARQTLLEHFAASTLEGYGCQGMPRAITASGAIIRYLQETQRPALKQVSRLSTYSTQSFMSLDPQTRRNLELFQGSRLGTSAGSLLSVLDLTRTAMGGRLLRRWLSQPLLDIPELTRRQDAVEWFHKDAIGRGRAISALGNVADLERLCNRTGSGIATPRELVALRRSLEAVPELRSALGQAEDTLSWLASQLKPCPELAELIERAIVDDPSASPGQGVVRIGFSEDLDKLRSASRNAKQYLANLERQERERSGIKSLKVGYNRVFGYYIEVSRPNLPQVPQDYIRKQTLVGGERFFTAELKEYESTILNAQERIEELETSIFRQVCQQVAAQGQRLLELAGAVAQLDVFAALAEVAVRHGYCRPQLASDDTIHIIGGRHPVVEQALADGSFVSNDTYLSNHDAQVLIITGPNMSGKSTYLRQVALIVLLAQVGSFVPAQSASIGLVDRIFTRVGLQDDLVSGQSTFMVEMVETASILNNATPRSLIVLDEIGRGTSTYDGISIAHAVAEYIHNQPRLGAKTLFATHYHELVELARYLPRVRNLNVAVAEEAGKVVFLRKIVPGGADKSYGIHVAQLAGLPRPVIGRAQEILSGLEAGRADDARPGGKRKKARVEAQQLPLLGQPSPLVEELAQLDVDSLTPLEAITRLYELKKRAREEA
ncbi:MAG: DNA mismatch repair protein MutS [Chloroflexi bacterium]|nr:DNA mismatch repair protein MutS [Chloroflexota bacterium]